MNKDRRNNVLFTIFGTVISVFGILILKGFVHLNSEGDFWERHPIFTGIIILIVGIIMIFAPVVEMIRNIKYKKSAYHELKKMEDSEIQNRLILIGETPIIERNKENITISIRQEHGSFDLTISLKEAYAVFNCESDEYHDSLTET
jgi:uncharacterized membrane protein